jgi:hypothetical protein
MTGEQLSVLIGELTPALAQRREQSRHARRGHQRRRAAGAGAKDSLSAADRILATVLYGRQLGTHALMAELFGVTRSTLTRALQDVQPLQREDPLAFLANRQLFGDLVDDERFTGPYLATLDSLYRRGAQATLKELF